MTAAVIPIKRLVEAKGRLSAVYTARQRRHLCLDLLGGMLTVMLGCSGLDLVAVVSPDERLGALLGVRFPGVRFLPCSGDLNLAAAHSAALLAAEGYDSMLFALGDLALLTGGELREALSLAAHSPVVLMPDRHGQGTNAILLTPPNLLPCFCFGRGSLAAHLTSVRAMGVEPTLLRRPGFAWDVDTPEDLRALSLEGASRLKHIRLSARPKRERQSRSPVGSRKKAWP